MLTESSSQLAPRAVSAPETREVHPYLPPSAILRVRRARTVAGRSTFTPYVPPQRTAMSTQTRLEEWPRLSILKMALFLLGLGLIGVGIFVARGNYRFPWMPGSMNQIFSPYLNNWLDIFVGLPVSLLGAVLSAAVVRRGLPDKLANLPLPVPALRREFLALAALVGAVICNAALYWHLIAHRYTHQDILIFFAGLVLAIFAVHRLDSDRERGSESLFERVDVLAAVGLGALSAAANSIDLVKWNFSSWGDEGAFFGAAKVIASGSQDWSFFDLTHVYGSHPALDSLYQALGLRLFGVNVVGWRLSEVLVVAVSTVLLYFAAVAMLGRIQAVAACLVFGTSHYLMAFTRLAYNNLHVVFYGALLLLVLALAWRTQRVVFVFLTGVVAGFCLYTFAIAVFLGPVLALLLLGIFIRRPAWKMLLAGGVMLAGFAVVVVPALLTTSPGELLSLAAANSYADLYKNNPNPIALIGLIDSTVVFWVNNQWRGHYVGGPLLDMVSGFLGMLGLAIAILRINRRAERLLLIWFVLCLVLIAYTRQGAEAHATRLMLLMPAAALLAGIGAYALFKVLRAGVHLSGRRSAVLVALLLASIPPLNVYQLVVDRAPLEGDNWIAMLSKALEENPGYAVIQVGATARGDANLDAWLDQYPWLYGRLQYVGLEQLGEPKPMGPSGKLPVYAVASHDENLVPQVRSKLPAGYQLVIDTDPRSPNKQWLFKPPADGRAIAPAGN